MPCLIKQTQKLIWQAFSEGSLFLDISCLLPVIYMLYCGMFKLLLLILRYRFVEFFVDLKTVSHLARFAKKNMVPNITAKNK